MAASPSAWRSTPPASSRARREAAIYERLGLAWVPPELREDDGEIEAAESGSLPKLVELSDIRGDLHTHTNWTDGTDTLEDMAKTAKARGYSTWP